MRWLFQRKVDFDSKHAVNFVIDIFVEINLIKNARSHGIVRQLRAKGDQMCKTISEAVKIFAQHHDAEQFSKEGDVGKIKTAGQAVVRKNFDVRSIAFGWNKNLRPQFQTEHRPLSVMITISVVSIKRQRVRKRSLQLVKIPQYADKKGRKFVFLCRWQKSAKGKA